MRPNISSTTSELLKGKSNPNTNEISVKGLYLKAIENSVGGKLFRNLYFDVNNKRTDILKNGILSCAAFVSWILKNFDLIKENHATVEGVIKDLEKSGWHKIKKPKTGTILVWEEKIYADGPHKHIGFYIGDRKAISNSYKLKVPTKHRWTFGVKNGKPVRRVIEIWRHKKLE